MAPEYEVNCMIREKGSSAEYKPAAKLEITARNEAEAAELLSRLVLLEPCDKSLCSPAELENIREDAKWREDHRPFDRDGRLVGGF